IRLGVKKREENKVRMTEEGTTLEYTPTWVVALVCTVIVFISLTVERIIHYTGKALSEEKEPKALVRSIAKGQRRVNAFGIHIAAADGFPSPHRQNMHKQRTCQAEKVPLLSTTALHHLHIFIFVLAVVHVTFCALTILFGGIKIRQWKKWEDSISKNGTNNAEEALKTKFTDVQGHDFIRGRFLGIGKNLSLLGWVHSFFKQIFGSVTEADYLTLRLGFIMTHCRGNRKFNFHKYMIRALEADFKKVVGISWYLWLFVVFFLCLNVSGLHAYFWLAFVPLLLLLAVGTKLEHVITQLAHEVAEKHVAIEGDLVVKPSDDHFWFHRPRLVLILIHIILFQNSFELAFFFWIWVRNVHFSTHFSWVFVQFLCSYSTLPLYAIVTQMGSSFKKAIFEEHIQDGLVDWARQAKKNKGMRKASNGSSQVGPNKDGSSGNTVGVVVELANVGDQLNQSERHLLGEIQPVNHRS
ncbi:hypothetical protein G4B88_009225, partial [Cannabis sativa]